MISCMILQMGIFAVTNFELHADLAIVVQVFQWNGSNGV